MHITLPEWSILIWGPGAVVYDATREKIEEGGEELLERLRNGRPLL